MSSEKKKLLEQKTGERALEFELLAREFVVKGAFGRNGGGNGRGDIVGDTRCAWRIRGGIL